MECALTFTNDLNVSHPDLFLFDSTFITCGRKMFPPLVRCFKSVSIDLEGTFRKIRLVRLDWACKPTMARDMGKICAGMVRKKDHIELNRGADHSCRDGGTDDCNVRP